MSDARFSRRERRPVRQFANMRSGEEIDAFLLANSEPMSPVLAALPSAHTTSASHAASAAAVAAPSAAAAATSRPASTATTTTGRGRGRPRGSGRKQRAAKAKQQQQQQLQQQLQQRQQQQQSVSRNTTGVGSLVVSDQHSSLFEEESSSDTGGAGPAVLGAAALRVQQEGHHHMHGNELYCICRRPYDPRMFMIGCDRCDGWFHAACVNISINEAKRMESYTCPNCKKPCQEPAAAVSTSSTAAAAVAVSASIQTPNTALAGTSTTKKRKRKHNGSGRSRGLFGFQHNDDIANLWMRFSDTYGQDTQQQKWIDAEDDNNVLLSDESEENNLDSVLVRRSLFVDLDHASEVGRDDFGSEEDLRRWQGLDASDRDQQMQRHIALKLLECDKTIDSLEIQKRVVELGLAFARRASLELRLETLAKSHADIALVARIDRQMCQPLPPSIVSSICLRCKGDVPTSELAEHLQRCLDIEPLPALSLHYVVVPHRHHHRDDTWLDEDDWDGSAPLLVCGYPKRLRAASSSASEPGTAQQCCQQRRSDCMEHTGWDGCVTAELAQRSSLLERRRRRLHDELQLIRERITRRLEFAIKYVQSNPLPQLSASPPAIHSLSNVATHTNNP